MRAFVVDAFTDVAFRGNPAAVVLLDGERDDAWHQQVAAEFRHSETAFVREGVDGTHDLRWFTPAVEVDLCGHATLAAAHVLAGMSGGGAVARSTFRTRSGELRAVVDPGGSITLDFPAQRYEEIDAPPGLADALGVRPVAVGTDGVDIVVDLADASAVAAVLPDLAALAVIPCRGVVVTAATDDDREDVAGAGADFVSRFFGPAVGVDEDPVTGSAHCTLGPLWSRRLGRDDLVGVQLSHRGGRVQVAVRGDRVSLTGRAVTVMAGDLFA